MICLPMFIESLNCDILCCLSYEAFLLSPLFPADPLAESLLVI